MKVLQLDIVLAIFEGPKLMQALPSCFSRLFCFQRRQAPTKKHIKLSGLRKMMVFQSPDCTVVEGHHSDHESEK